MIRKQILFAAAACGVLTSPLVAQIKEPIVKKQSVADIADILPAHAFLPKGSKCSSCHTGGTEQLLPAWTGDVSTVWSRHSGAVSLTKSGATLSLLDPTTRAILRLPAKSGVAVTGMCPTENKNLAGLQKHDIVLTVNDKPASDVATVERTLAGSGEMGLVILRKGKKQELKRAEAKPKAATVVQRYLLGISLGDLDPIVRTQLGLDETVAVFIQNVTADGAAEAAGVKQHDVVLKINGKPADSTATVQAVVKESKGKPIRLLLLRDGEKKDLEVQPRLTETAADLKSPLPYHNPPGAPMQTWRANTDVWQVLGLEPATAGFIAEYAQSSTTAEKLATIEKKIDELTNIIKSLEAAK